VKRFVAALLGLLLVAAVPAASMAYGKANREAEMTRVMRSVLAQTKDPQQVAQLLSEHGARFVGFRESTVTFAHTGDAVVPVQSTQKAIGPDFNPSVTERKITTGITPMAGNKADLTLTMWLYEWQNYDGTFTEQTILNGRWSATEYRWMDDPADVIDVRWIVGDLVYLSSAPYDGVQRDQHTQGIASFTVDDQVADWDLYVNFRPVSPAVYGRWTNVFANYTHTWWGVRLGVSLQAGPTGSTGTLTINTDAKTWTEGLGLAFQIGSQDLRGPVTSGQSVEE
jgi:type II secretory pathway pseudopilin PulG